MPSSERLVADIMKIMIKVVFVVQLYKTTSKTTQRDAILIHLSVTMTSCQLQKRNRKQIPTEHTSDLITKRNILQRPFCCLIKSDQAHE